MNVCIIGGAGFIGANLTKLLINLGHKVIVVGRKKGRPVGLNEKAIYLHADDTCNYLNADLIKDVEQIYYLAHSTIPKTSYEDPVLDLVGNVPAFVSALEGVKQLKLRKFIFVSSGGTVYGPSEKFPIDEGARTMPISPYGISKLTCENYALMYHRLHGVPVVIVRPSNAYGEGQAPFKGQGFIATALGMTLKNSTIQIFGMRGTTRDYIHVADLAEGILAASEHGKIGEIYNLGTGLGFDNLDIINYISDLPCLPSNKIKYEIFPSRNFDVPVNILSYGKIFEHTGWHPKISLQSGLARMWASMRESRA